MDYTTIKLPKTKKGRKSESQHIQYNAQLADFANDLMMLQVEIAGSKYIKARKQYKTDRTRYLKALKHRESGSMLVDHSIEQFKANKKYRSMKDSTWKTKQLINWVPASREKK